MRPVPPEDTLRRALSLPLLTFYGLGNILGAGIYVLIGKIVSHAGMFTPLSFLLACLLAGLTAFSYAELAARYPLSAGEAAYVHHGLGTRRLPAVVGLLIVLVGIASSATILRGFTGYLQVFVDLPQGLSLPLIVLMLGGLAAWGIVESVAAVALITLVEIAGLLLIVWIGLPGLASPPHAAAALTELPETAFWPGILVGAFLAFFAFIGFEDMVNVAEEVHEPQRNLPRAILLALALSAILYLLVALVAIDSLSVESLAESEAPLALLYQQVTGRDPWVVTGIGILAMVNGGLIQIIMASRVLYGMARQGWLPRPLGRVHHRRHTPLLATLIVSALVMIATLSATTEGLAKASSYFLLVVFTLVNLSLWRIKTRLGRPAGTVDVPLWIPAAGFVGSLSLLLTQGVIDLGV